MADDRLLVTDWELDASLHDLARYVVLPSSPDLAQRVRMALLAEAAGNVAGAPLGESWWTRRGRRVLMILAACLVLAALVLVVSPAARAAVARLLGVRGVEITRMSPGDATPAVVGGALQLGSRTTLASAQRHVTFTITVPHFGAIAAPDEVYLGTTLPGQVSLVYRARAGFPRAAGTGVGLLITEFRAGIEMMFFKKLLAMGTTLEVVRMQGARGVWLGGAPHFFGYAMSNGNVIEEPLRFAGNTLLWERAGVTYRLEGSVSRNIAVRIAESMH